VSLEGPVPRSVAGRLAAFALVLLALVAPSTAAAKQGPVISNFSAAFAYGLIVPDLDPRGANNWNCKPTAAHPRPLVLLHGSFANRFNSFAAMAPVLKGRGYCVFALDYGRGPIAGLNGVAGVRSSSRELAAYVDRVLAATGAPQVDLVAYSQGGLVARSYLKYDGGADSADPSQNRVHTFVGLSNDHHGTDLVGAGTLVNTFHASKALAGVLGQGAADQLIGSSFLKALNTGPETAPGIDYTLIGTRSDEISEPYTRSFLTAGPGATVKNITLQQGCPTDLSDHFNITYSRRSMFFVLKALDPAFAARPPCQFLLPVL
jgi:triacylglycerol esterase/lipase EstA (alpha/beta hydrolase family)